MHSHRLGLVQRRLARATLFSFWVLLLHCLLAAAVGCCGERRRPGGCSRPCSVDQISSQLTQRAAWRSFSSCRKVAALVGGSRFLRRSESAGNPGAESRQHSSTTAAIAIASKASGTIERRADLWQPVGAARRRAACAESSLQHGATSWLCTPESGSEMGVRCFCFRCRARLPICPPAGGTTATPATPDSPRKTCRTYFGWWVLALSCVDAAAAPGRRGAGALALAVALQLHGQCVGAPLLHPHQEVEDEEEVDLDRVEGRSVEGAASGGGGGGALAAEQTPMAPRPLRAGMTAAGAVKQANPVTAGAVKQRAVAAASQTTRAGWRWRRRGGGAAGGWRTRVRCVAVWAGCGRLTRCSSKLGFCPALPLPSASQVSQPAAEFGEGQGALSSDPFRTLPTCSWKSALHPSWQVRRCAVRRALVHGRAERYEDWGQGWL